MFKIYRKCFGMFYNMDFKINLFHCNVLQDGTIEPDVALGRQLMQAVCLEALMPKNELKTCYENTIQDGLMITYLKNLACLQFSIAEKLNASFHS
jgi:hypothetical protein